MKEKVYNIIFANCNGGEAIRAIKLDPENLPLDLLEGIRNWIGYTHQQELEESVIIQPLKYYSNFYQEVDADGNKTGSIRMINTNPKILISEKEEDDEQTN